MGIFDRARESTSGDRQDRREKPASEQPDESTPSGQVSEAGSSFDNVQSATGGADAVPDTPDTTEENHT
jgi:hypothetical protein